MHGRICKALGATGKAVGRQTGGGWLARLLPGALTAAVVALVPAPPALAARYLTPVPGSPFTTAAGPLALDYSPASGLLASADADAAKVSVFSIAKGGALSPVPGSPFATGSHPSSVAFNPAGKLLATANASSVSVFTIGPGGTLTPVSGSPFAVSTPTAVAFSPNGKFLDVANAGTGLHGTVSVFSVAPGGQLSAVAGSPFAAGTVPTALAFSPDGLRLAVTDGPGPLMLFSVGSGGQLTSIPESQNSGVNPAGVAFSPNGALLAVSSDAGVSVYSGASSGTVTPVPGSPFYGGTGTSVGFSPTGRMLATTENENDTLAVFWVGRNGVLSFAHRPFSPGAGPSSVAFMRGGALLAVAFGADKIAVFKVPPQQVSVKTKRAITQHHRVKIKLHCLDGPPATICRGRLALTIRIKGKKIKLGRASFSLKEGAVHSVKLRLSQRAMNLINSAPNHQLRVHAATRLNGRFSTRSALLLIAGS